MSALVSFRRAFAPGLFLACGTAFAATNTVNSPGIDFFESKIRPVLVENCYQCHSHQSEKVRGGLMLDTRDDLLKGGDSGPVIVPHRPEQSLLIKAVGYADAELQMPPKDHKLPDAQIADLRAWVKMGAPDPRNPGATYASQSLEAARKHWAFQPITAPPVPKAQRRKSWIQTPLDAFVLDNLNTRDLRPSPPADKRTLIRRATFDLLGLPPTPEEVDAFLADHSKEAFAKVVDRLLASPHYGERWGRYWLDVARYADTKGLISGRDSSRLPYAYAYRDYVIRACNDDLPVNRFILEQLAADQLPATNDNCNLAAMGFLTVGRRFFENENEIIDDRIDVVSRGLLGLTVSCARCHDHKFDPISTRDYYALHGIFNSSFEPPELPLLTEPLPAGYTNYLTDLRTNQENLDRFVHSNEVAALEGLRSRAGDYLLAVHEAAPFATNTLRIDEMVRARKLNKSVFLSWQTNLTRLETNQARLFAAWKALVAGASNYPGTNLNPLVAQEFSGKTFTNLSAAAAAYNRLFAQAATNGSDAELRQFFEATNSPLNPPRADFVKLLIFDDATRNKIDALKRKVAEVEATDPGAPPRAMVLRDKPHPANSKIFLRGNPGTKGAEAPREFLSVIRPPGEQPFPKQVSGRLQLAQDIVSPQNPLTARVFVNRVWMHHFGESLVVSPGDFGVRTERPVEAGLLDYLAGRFMQEGWSLKKLHRLIMLSSVYQQNSAFDAANAKIDPENTCFWRMNPSRLDFEAMRDSLLSVAGELDSSLGGQPVDITSNNAPPRRTVYGLIDRQNLPGVFRAFDFANPDTSSSVRFETFVAPQALFLLNSPLISQCARAVAGECDACAATNENAAVEQMYRRLFQRRPTRQELTLAEDFVREQPLHDAVVPETTAWQYGAGCYDEASRSTRDFQTLPYFNNATWFPRAKMPDPKLGSVQLNAIGGVPGKTNIAAIRRWTAPRDGVISVTGELAQGQKAGDGFCGRIVSSRLGLLGQWKIGNDPAATALENVEVKEGDTIDFMVERQPGARGGNFKWAPRVEMATMESDETGLPCVWDAHDNFIDPRKQPKPLNPWEKYAQVLLISNEFFFVE